MQNATKLKMVGMVGIEPTMFTLRAEFYRLVRHNQQSPHSHKLYYSVFKQQPYKRKNPIQFLDGVSLIIYFRYTLENRQNPALQGA